MVNKSFLVSPIFEDRHRTLAEAFENWCKSHLPVDHRDVNVACRELVAMLGRDGWLKRIVFDPDTPGPLDVRTLCLMRETLARYDGLADFAFAMQGIGSAAVGLYIGLFGGKEERE